MHRGTTPESAPLSILQKQALRRQCVMKHTKLALIRTVFSGLQFKVFIIMHISKICKYMSGVMLRYLFLGGWEAGDQHFVHLKNWNR